MMRGEEDSEELHVRTNSAKFGTVPLSWLTSSHNEDAIWSHHKRKKEGGILGLDIIKDII